MKNVSVRELPRSELPFFFYRNKKQSLAGWGEKIRPKSRLISGWSENGESNNFLLPNFKFFGLFRKKKKTQKNRRILILTRFDVFFDWIAQQVAGSTIIWNDLKILILPPWFFFFFFWEEKWLNSSRLDFG